MATVRDLAKAFDDLGYSYGWSADREHILAHFSDTLAPVTLVLSVHSGVVEVEASGIAKLEKDEMAEVLSIAERPPRDMVWARDPDSKDVWARRTLELPQGRMDKDLVNVCIDELMLAIYNFRTAIPRMQARRDP
jgi:hypothetical protein